MKTPAFMSRWFTGERRPAPTTAPALPQDEQHHRLAWEVERLTEALSQRDAALVQAQTRAQSYLDVVGVMVVLLNSKGNIVLSNRTACEVLGCDTYQCTGLNWFQQYLPEDARKAAAEAYLRLMAGEAELEPFHESQVLTRLGERRLIAWHNTLLRGRDGNLVGVLSAGEDITEARRVQEALRQSEERLRLAQEIARVGTYEWDIETGEITWTPELEALYGLAPGGFERSMAHWLSMIHPDDQAQARRQIELALTSGERVEGEWRVLWPDGGIRWLAGRGRVRRDETGRPRRMTGINIDISERKLLEEEQRRLQAQLQQAQKMEALGQLTGGIAHDFNNILASVLGFSRLALRRHVPDSESELAGYLREIIHAGERARDLVAKMLAFGRVSPGQGARSCSAAPLAREALGMLAAAIPASIRIEADCPADLPDIAMDPVAFHQVLINLVINARDAVGEKGEIAVRLRSCRLSEQECHVCHERCSGDFIEMEVQDTGPGISPEILPRIFDPFFTTKPPGKGSGMGLSMVHGLVRAVGGHFRVESPPGGGATFHVYLPTAGAAAVTLPGAAAPAAGTVAGARRRVLLVDDEAAILRLLCVTLESEGWSVSAHSHPLTALEEFQDAPHAFTALISDQAMPDMTGIELIQAVLRLRPDLPALLCTGYSERLDEAGARRLGVRRFFLKPVDGDALVAALEAETLSSCSPPAP
ncbi:MAG: PAS domain-containing protein [Betaproteobacteria bacterium]|nr:PAS domain-containing protein [Betaproteobacteria bacterium]